MYQVHPEDLNERSDFFPPAYDCRDIPARNAIIPYHRFDFEIAPAEVVRVESPANPNIRSRVPQAEQCRRLQPVTNPHSMSTPAKGKVPPCGLPSMLRLYLMAITHHKCPKRSALRVLVRARMVMSLETDIPCRFGSNATVKISSVETLFQGFLPRMIRASCASATS